VIEKGGKHVDWLAGNCCGCIVFIEKFGSNWREFLGHTVANNYCVCWYFHAFWSEETHLDIGQNELVVTLVL